MSAEPTSKQTFTTNENVYKSFVNPDNTMSQSFYFFNVLYLAFLKSALNLNDAKELAKENLTKYLTLFNSFCFWLSIFPFLCFVGKFYLSGNLGIISSNLPGITKKSNELFWETLVSPFDYTEKIIHHLNAVDIHSNAILLNHKQINNSLQTLIEYYDLTHSNDLQKSLNFKEFKPRETFTKNLDLDEIPMKLEGTNKTFSITKIVSLPNSQSNEFSKFISNKSKNFKTALLKEKQKLKIIKTENLKINSNPNFFVTNQDISLKDWQNFSIANETLFNYFRSEFLNTGEINLKTETSLVRPRQMTGYNYPDMNSDQVWRLQVNPNENHGNALTVSYYPKSIYFNSVPTSLRKMNVSIPYFDVSQQTSNLDNGDTAGIFLKHDPKTLDLVVENKKEFQNSFFEQVIQNNFESNKSIYFFANLTKDNFENFVSSTLLKNENKEKVLNNLAHSIIPTSSFFALPDTKLSVQDIKNYYDPKFSDILGENYSNLIQVSDLRTGEISYYYSSSSNKNPKILLTNFQTKTDVSEHTFALNFSNQTINLTKPFVEYSSNIYKRELDSYWKNKLKWLEMDEFLTVNESITINSIFSLSLFGFLISTFLILKTAYGDYAKEFSSYLLDLISSGKGLPLDPSTIEWLNQELGIEEKKGGIRVFPKHFSKKRFTDIAGIRFLLPELSELVWFLRNKGRKFSVTRLTSKSVLLVGPPGTGKTLLVQALAAEAEVPVVAQSTSVLSSIGQDLTPGDAIRMAFQKARSLAPCILFLDELDSLGLKRDSLLLNQAEQNLSNPDVSFQNSSNKFFEKSQNLETEITENSDSWVENKSDYLTNQLRINITNEFNQRKQQERDQVAALTQLLIEIDGLQANNGILVIGATNRPNVLDPALTRPGRFSKIISLPLPDKPKRIEVLKLYSKELGWKSDINWDYLAQRTKGFSAGDLAAIANQSSIQAILQDSKHNLETFENAITTLTTYPSQNTNKFVYKDKAISNQSDVCNDPYFSLREVYYKTGQTLYNYIFNVEGKTAFIELISREPNPRQYQISANLNQDKNRLRVRYELENILTSLVSGKASEILMLLTNSNKSAFYWESDFAKKDFYEATGLVITMMQDWYLYSSDLYQQKFLNIPITQNEFEYKKNEEVFELLLETVKYLEQQLTLDYRIPASESLAQKAKWKIDSLQELSSIDGLFAEWSRFHLPDPQETDRNQEWIPPEEYFHDNDTKRLNFKTSTKSEDFKVRYLELLLIERERYAQKILINAFNKAFLFLEENRELLDTLSCFLLKRKILRQFEIENLISSK